MQSLFDVSQTTLVFFRTPFFRIRASILSRSSQALASKSLRFNSGSWRKWGHLCDCSISPTIGIPLIMLSMKVVSTVAASAAISLHRATCKKVPNSSLPSSCPERLPEYNFLSGTSGMLFSSSTDLARKASALASQYAILTSRRAAVCWECMTTSFTTA